MNNGFKLNHKDVLSVNEDDSPLNSSTFKAGDLICGLADHYMHEDDAKKWTISGVPCEVLRPGEPWQKGKVTISLHFIPDEEISTLDTVRSDLNI
jgi:hypothetical protein